MTLVQRAHGRHHGDLVAFGAPAGNDGAKLPERADDRDAHAGFPPDGFGASGNVCSMAGKRRSRTSPA